MEDEEERREALIKEHTNRQSLSGIPESRRNEDDTDAPVETEASKTSHIGHIQSDGLSPNFPGNWNIGSDSESEDDEGAPRKPAEFVETPASLPQPDAKPPGQTQFFNDDDDDDDDDEKISRTFDKGLLKRSRDEASRRIQRNYRDYQAIKAAKAERLSRKKARKALLVQQAARAHIAAKSSTSAVLLKRSLRAVHLLQAAARSTLAAAQSVREVERRRRNCAAKRLQNWWREAAPVVAAKREMGAKRGERRGRARTIRREEMSVVIQKFFRGYRVRKNQELKKRNIAKQEQLRQQVLGESKIVILRYWRKYKSVLDVRTAKLDAIKRKKAVVIQKNVRMHQKRKRYRELIGVRNSYFGDAVAAKERLVALHEEEMDRQKCLYQIGNVICRTILSEHNQRSLLIAEAQSVVDSVQRQFTRFLNDFKSAVVIFRELEESGRREIEIEEEQLKSAIISETRVTTERISIIKEQRRLKHTQIIAEIDSGNHAEVQKLLDRGVNPNSLATPNKSLLQYAVACSTISVVEVLLNAGANVDSQVEGKCNRTLIEYSLQNPSRGVMEYLLKRGLPHQSSSDVSSFNQAIMIGKSIQWLNTLLKFGACNKRGLHNACKYGRLECIEYLRGEVGMDIDEVDPEMGAPIHQACISSQHEAVKLLLRMKCNLNIQNGNGDTPLHLCCERTRKESQDICRSLIEAGCDINISNSFKMTALQVSMKYDNPPMIELLLSLNCEVDRKADCEVLREMNSKPMTTYNTSKFFKSTKFDVNTISQLQTTLRYSDKSKFLIGSSLNKLRPQRTIAELERLKASNFQSSADSILYEHTLSNHTLSKLASPWTSLRADEPMQRKAALLNATI